MKTKHRNDLPSDTYLDLQNNEAPAVGSAIMCNGKNLVTKTKKTSVSMHHIMMSTKIPRKPKLNQ